MSSAGDFAPLKARRCARAASPSWRRYDHTVTFASTAVRARPSGPASAPAWVVARPRQLLAPALTPSCELASDMTAGCGETGVRLSAKVSLATGSAVPAVLCAPTACSLA